MRNYAMTLDVKSTTRNPIIWIRMGDVESTKINVKVCNGGETIDLTNWQPYFECVLPSGLNAIRDSSGFSMNLINEGVFDYTLTSNLFAESGKINQAYFAFEQKDDEGNIVNRMTTRPFKIHIMQDATGHYVPPKEGFLDVQDFQDYVKALKQNLLEDANQIIETLKEEMATSLDVLIQESKAMISQWEEEFQAWFKGQQDVINAETIEHLQSQMAEALLAVKNMNLIVQDADIRLNSIGLDVLDLTNSIFYLDDNIYNLELRVQALEK